METVRPGRTEAGLTDDREQRVTASGAGRLRRRWVAIACSVAIHVALLAVVVHLPGRSAHRRDSPRPRVDIVFYPETAPPEPIVEPIPAPDPIVKPRPEPRIAEKPPAPEVAASRPAPPPTPTREPPPPPPQASEPMARATPPPATPEVRTRVFAAAEPVEPAATPKPREIRSNVFGAAEPSADAPASAPRRAVTGIFTSSPRPGDVKVAAPTGPRAETGAFADAAGASSRGRTENRPRAVASTGFANAGATPTPSSAAPVGSGSVERGSFGDFVVVARPSRPRETTRPEPDIPVEIISKPKPLYTDEARRLRVEGEVVLEVTFAATGRLSIHRIVQGLGHGLDEAAVDAARSIDFKPARRAGQPVDYRATLRVVFQLA